jgi:osmotically-inducible protein OsmY
MPSSDNVLKTLFLAELAWEPEVTADGGKVTPTGHVGSGSERGVADAAAWAAPGVTDVENDLIIA